MTVYRIVVMWSGVQHPSSIANKTELGKALRYDSGSYLEFLPQYLPGRDVVYTSSKGNPLVVIGIFRLLGLYPFCGRED
jgi:hypothetical protein